MRRIRRLIIRATLSLVATVLAAIVFGPWLAPRMLGLFRSDLVFRVDDRRPGKTVYLTIDDAPSDATGAILATLAKHRVSATFFVTTDRITAPERLRGIRAQGHALGHHMDSTKPAADYSLADFEQAFERADRALQTFQASHLYRPPSGWGTREQSAYARAQGYLPISGTAYPMDHSLSDAGWIAALTEWMCTDGAIIILHDGNERGPRTAAVLDKLIPGLRASGYQFGILTDDIAGAAAPAAH